jgi:membrane protease YdiL (CAAX protease family)
MALPYAVLLFGLFPFQGRYFASILHGADGVVVYLVGHLAQLVEILLFVAVMAALEKRPFGDFGLPWREALRSRFWSGAGVGVVALTVLVLALAALGALELRLPARPGLISAAFALGYGVLFSLLALREEFLYRGYGQVKLAQATGFWPASLVTSAWFAATHNGPTETAIGLANVALFGLVACLTLLRTGNLWFAIGFHAAWDWGETYLFGVADSGHPAAPGHLFTARVPAAATVWLSGGSVGPEGSVLCVAILVLLGVAFARWLSGPTSSLRFPDARSR